MVKIYFIVNLILLSILFSCKEKNEIVVKNDCESVAGWYSVANLKMGNGHSGSWYFLAGADSSSAFTYRGKLKEISNYPIESIDMSAWFNTPDTFANAKYVLRIDSMDIPVLYYSIHTWEEYPFVNTWTRIFNRIYLPAGLNPELTVNIYAFNLGEIPVYFDDFEVKFIYQNPLKGK